MSGRAVEAAGDVDTLLLDKTGTITLGNRMATELMPAARRARSRSWPTRRSSPSLADETPEGRSIVVLVKEQLRPARPRRAASSRRTFIPFTRPDAHERLRPRRAASSARAPSTRSRRTSSALGRRGARPRSSRSPARHRRRRAARRSPSPTAPRVLGIIHLKDIVKGGINERFDRFRAMGIRTVMITGDNPRTAAAIAARGRRRRLPRRGDARGQDAAHQGRAGQGQARGHDRRRHQRRPGAGPGRRRRGHEHRHAGGQGGRQHGRPRLATRPSCSRSSRSASSC